MFSFLKSHFKSLMIISLIVGIATFYYKWKILHLENTVLENEKVIIELENENNRIIKINNDLNLVLEEINSEIKTKDDIIDSMNSHADSIKVQYESELEILTKKYEYCIDNKISTNSSENLEVLDENTSKLYLDMYNSRIFN